MQRLFTSFPHGWPGIGLLLLRCSLVFELSAQMYQRQSALDSKLLFTHAADAVGLVAGILLFIGLLTPLGAIAGAIASLNLSPMTAGASGFVRQCWVVHLLAFASSVVLVGPGKYSVDGRIFGQREIIVQRFGDSDQDR